MNILITAIGSMSALCAINKLHEAGHKVIGCDIYPKEWHFEAFCCDVFAQAPYANTKEYIPFLIDLAKKENVKYIFPLTDLEIDVINEHREIFEKNDYLNEIYADDIEGAKEDLRVLEITPKEAAYLDHRTHPIFTRKFKF